MVNKESIKAIEKIRKLYSKKYNADQIDQELSMSGMPLEQVIEDEKQMVKTLGKTLENMEQSMKELHGVPPAKRG